MEQNSVCFSIRRFAKKNGGGFTSRHIVLTAINALYRRVMILCAYLLWVISLLCLGLIES